MPLEEADIARFIENGPGNDREAVNTEIQKPVKPDIVKLTVELPRDLHRRYKASCAARGVKMGEEVRNFIEDRISTMAWEA